MFLDDKRPFFNSRTRGLYGMWKRLGVFYWWQSMDNVVIFTARQAVSLSNTHTKNRSSRHFMSTSALKAGIWVSVLPVVRHTISVRPGKAGLEFFYSPSRYCHSIAKRCKKWLHCSVILFVIVVFFIPFVSHWSEWWNVCLLWHHWLWRLL